MQKHRDAMSEIPPNVKVYDRPERAGLSPIIIAVIVLVVLVIGYFVYRGMNPSNAAPQTRTTSATRADVGRYDFVVRNQRITRSSKIIERV